MAYGPYGGLGDRQCRIFAVNGKINSIFGRVVTTTTTPPLTALGAIGFYYEDESRTSQST